MTWFDELQQAEFAGHVFQVVRRTAVSGGVQSATETIVGQGSRRRPIAADVRTYSFEAYLTGDNVLARAEALTARLVSARDGFSGLLVHPHFGAVDAVASQWSVTFAAREIDFATLSLEFAASEFDAEDPAVPALTIEDTQLAIVAVADDIPIESPAGLELASLADERGIPVQTADSVPGSVTAALLVAPGSPATGVPGAIQSLGVGLRALEASQLLSAGRDTVSDRLLLEATRADSVEVMGMRELWREAVRAFGPADSLAVEGGGRSFAAVSVALGIDLIDLATRNPDAGGQFFSRGLVYP